MLFYIIGYWLGTRVTLIILCPVDHIGIIRCEVTCDNDFVKADYLILFINTERYMFNGVSS